MSKKHRSLFIQIFVAALILRFSLFLIILLGNTNGFFNTDAHQYNQIAENVIHQGTFSLDTSPPFTPDHSRTPVYPLFISFLKWTGFNIPGITFIQILLSSITCSLVFLLILNLFGNWKPALIGAAIVVLDIPSIVYANMLLTETLFTFLIVLSAIFLVIYFKEARTNHSLYGSAVCTGVAILCRPIAVLLPFFFILLFFLFLKSPMVHRMSQSLKYWAVCFLIVTPWLVRNYAVFGSPVLSTIGYHNLLHYRAAGVFAEKEGLSMAQSEKRLLEMVNSEFQGDIEHQPIAYKKFQAKFAMSYLMDNLPLYVKNHFISNFNMLFRPIRSTLDIQFGYTNTGTTLTTWGEEESPPLVSRLLQKTSLPTTVLVMIQLILLSIVWLAFILGIVILVERKELFPLVLTLTVIVYFCLMSGGPEAYARFRVPIMPFITALSGIGLTDFLNRLNRKSKKIIENEIDKK